MMNNQRGDHGQVDSLMQSLLSKIPKAATPSDKKNSSSSSARTTTTPSLSAGNDRRVPGRTTSSSDSKNESNTLIGSDLDMREIELITQRLAQDLNTASFLSDDEDDSDNEDEDLSDDEDDEEFRKQILREFSSVMNKDSESAADKVSKQSLKMLYLQLLSQGPTLLTSQDQADKFISKLTATEVRALTDLLQKSPDEILQFFNGDEMVKRAIDNQNTINLSSSMSGDADELRRGLWKDLTSDDLLSTNDTGADASRNSLKDAPVAVREAVKAFENNALHYSQHPAALLQLCEKLSSHDQNIFLDILYREYTPERMEKLIEKEKKQRDSSSNSTSSTSENQNPAVTFKFDGDLVAHVFKEVLTHFRMFKKYPHKFDPLLSKMNEQERQAFDSLVKAFWDLKLEQIKL